MSETPLKAQQAKGEKLYRYHPETGFTEVTPAQMSTTQNTQAESEAPFWQNPNYFTQASPYGHNLACATMGMPPQALAHHEAHMKQMQEIANAQMAQAVQAAQAAHAAQMAFMTQNAAMFGAMQNSFDNTDDNDDKKTEFSTERMQAMYQTVNDVMNGKAEPTKMLGLLDGISTDFWKGAALGVAAIALYNYTPLKDVIHTSLGTLLAAAGLKAKDANSSTCDDGYDDELDEDGFYKEAPTEENKQ